MSPFLALLPVRGKVSSLPALSNSLYARYEKVQTFLKDSDIRSDRQLARRFLAEEAMLRQVLDWLAIRSKEE